MAEIKKPAVRLSYTSEDAYAFQRDLELIEKSRSERPKLTLVKGGAAGDPSEQKSMLMSSSPGQRKVA